MPSFWPISTANSAPSAPHSELRIPNSPYCQLPTARAPRLILRFSPAGSAVAALKVHWTFIQYRSLASQAAFYIRLPHYPLTTNSRAQRASFCVLRSAFYIRSPLPTINYQLRAQRASFRILN